METPQVENFVASAMEPTEGESSKQNVNIKNSILYVKRKQMNLLSMFGRNKKKRHVDKYGCDECTEEPPPNMDNENEDASARDGKAEANLSTKESSEALKLAQAETLRIAEACNLWQDRWLVDYPWLEFNRELGRVFCKVCLQQPKRHKNVFGTVGSTNLRASAWLEHGRSKIHRDIYKDQIQAEKEAINNANITVREKKEAALWNLFKVAYFIAKENLPYSKFQAELLLLRSLGLKTMTKSLYQHDKACAEFIKFIAESLQADIVKRMMKSPFFGLMVDESTDIGDKKSLIVYASFIEDHSPVTCFLCLKSVENETAESIFQTIMDVVTTFKLDSRKLLGFGSDGAGVMIGSVTGVATRLKGVSPFLSNIHCVAHRCNLACSGPASKLPYARFIDSLVNATVAFFANSCRRQLLLRSLEEEYANDILKLSKINTTRWLSHHGAIKRICDVLQPVLHAIKSEIGRFSAKKRKDLVDLTIDGNDDPLTQEDLEAHLVSTSKSKKLVQSAAKKLLKRLIEFKSIYVLHFLADLLGRLSSLSLLFQRDYIEVGAVSGIVANEIAMIQLEYIDDLPTNLNAGTFDSKGYPLLPDFGPENGYIRRLQGCIRGCTFYDFEISRCALGSDLEEAIAFQKEFSQAIIDGLCKQFRENSHLDAFKVLSPLNIPKCMREMKDYGFQEITTLCDFYGEEKTDASGVSIPPFVKVEEIRKEYKAFKVQAVTEWRGRSFRDTWGIIASNEQLKEKYAGLCTLASIALVQCANSAACERGFSRYNLIKDKKRSKLCSMDALMCISLEGSSDYDALDFSSAISSWTKSAEYRHIFVNSNEKLM